MGKRKSRAKPVKKVVAKVPTTFDCPFCNHEKAVDCKIDKDTQIGSIRCRICNESFQMITTCTPLFSSSSAFLCRISSSSGWTDADLSEPIDVYSEWIDQCEAANQ